MLLNEEHAHLREATLGFMWTSVPNARGGNGVVGQAEIPSVQGGKWARPGSSSRSRRGSASSRTS